jgi:glycosyltransferase involved in cell wall biosynthesis
LPIVESLWFGKPCLCANFGAMAAVAIGGGCLTVDTRSIRALTRGIERLSTDAALRQRLAYEAVSRQMRSWRDYAGAVLGALESQKGVAHAYYWVDFTVRHPINTGVQRVTRALARGLERLGVELEFVQWDYQAGRFAPLDDEQRRHLAKWNGPVYRPPQPLSGGAAAKWLIVPEVLTPPQPAAAEVIHIARALSMKTAFLFYDLIALKLSDIYPSGFVDGFVKFWRMMREVDVILPISQAAADDLVTFYAQDSGAHLGDLIITCPLAGEFIEMSRSYRIRERDGSSASILCVGTIEPRKNQLQVVDAFRRLWETGMAAGLSLTIVGSSHSFPELAGELKRRIADMPDVVFLDHVDDKALQQLYAACDFTVYASCEEGFGLPILESLWNARPCLCHNAGAIAEVAAPGGCLMIDMRDLDALCAGMLSLSRDHDLYARLAAECVGRPIKTWTDYAGELMGILGPRTHRPMRPAKPITTFEPQALFAGIPHLAVIYDKIRDALRLSSSGSK